MYCLIVAKSNVLSSSKVKFVDYSKRFLMFSLNEKKKLKKKRKNKKTKVFSNDKHKISFYCAMNVADY